jgi:hypothetical protein
MIKTTATTATTSTSKATSKHLYKLYSNTTVLFADSDVDRETLASKERLINSASDVDRETLAAKDSSGARE